MKLDHRFDFAERLSTADLDRYKTFSHLMMHKSCVWWMSTKVPTTVDRLEEGRLSLGILLRSDSSLAASFRMSLSAWRSVKGKRPPIRLTWAWFRSGRNSAILVVFPNKTILATAIRDCEVLVIMES